MKNPTAASHYLQRLHFVGYQLSYQYFVVLDCLKFCASSLVALTFTLFQHGLRAFNPQQLA
jgi:hypothetical protein